MKKIILLIIIIGFSNCINSQNVTKEQVLTMGEILGFFYGQELSIQNIKKNHPDLINEVTRAELKWKLSFGKVETEIEKKLKAIFKENYKDFLFEAEKQMHQYGNFDFSEKSEAMSFIEKIYARANGDIEEEYRSKILSYHPDYILNPHKEFLKGYKSEFETKGSEDNAKGIKLKFQYPGSWTQKVGYLPNILFKAVSFDGNGEISMSVLIKDLSIGLKDEMSKEEWNYLISREGNIELADFLFSENDLKNGIIENGILDPKFKNYSRVEISRNPGAKIEVSGYKKRVDVNLPMRMMQYIFISEKYLVITSFSILQGDNIEKYLPTIHLIMNSMVTLNKYD